MKADYFEYDPQDPESWVVKEPPSRPDWFDSELRAIAGVNRHGQPNLRLVWGGTELSDRSENVRLKYHAGWSQREVKGWRYRKDGEWVFTESIDDLDPTVMVFPDTSQEQLGVPRWIIERWVSPEELEETNRFQNRKEFHDTEKVLRDFPREGVYDAYFVVENLQGKFRQIDRDVAHFIKMKWSFEQKSLAEIDRLVEEYDQREQEQMDKHDAELWDAALDFDLRLDDEERERREEYWAKHHDYVAELKHMMAQT